jgi:hypothetical protein
MNLQHMVTVDNQEALGVDVELDSFSSTHLSSHLRFRYFSSRLRNHDVLLCDCRSRWLLPSLWTAGDCRCPSVACSADGGPKIVSCHHTMEIYGTKNAFLASVLSMACVRLTL